MPWSKTNIASLIPIVLLIIFVFLVYADTLRYDFVWDDEDLIQRNPTITKLGDSFSFFKIEPLYRSFYYRPLVSISLALDYQLWKLKPFGYHLSNVIFHLGSVLLIYFIFLSCMPQWSSFLVALLFGLHPIHTESVTFVSGRSDVLCSLFFLASLLCFDRFLRITTKRRTTLYILSLIFFLCSLLTKEMAVTLPLALLVWWIFFSDEVSLKQKKWKEIFLLLVPFVLLLFIFLFWRRTILGHWGYSGAKFDFLFLGLGTTIWIILKYVQLLFLPLRLNAFYDIIAGAKGLNFTALLGLGILVLALILVFLCVDKKKQKFVILGLAWFLLTLLPVANLIPTTNVFLAERYLYLPSLGYCLIFGWLLGGLLTKRVLPSRFTLRISVASLLVGLTIFYAGRTIQRNRDWENNLAFAQSFLREDPNSVIGHYYMGVQYVKDKEYEKAKEEYLTALKLKPDVHGAHFNLGMFYYQEDKMEQAKEEFKKEIEVDSFCAEAYYNIGTIYKNSGQVDSSIQAFQKTLDLAPDFLFALENLAIVYEAQGDYRKALPLWEKALKLEQDSAWISDITERIKNIKTFLLYQSK
jgi:tetratricopeptide (TPR) repeat protein